MLNLAALMPLSTCGTTRSHFSFWRPITAIRLGDADGNPMTVGDASWTPLIGTPPYPDHASGYNGVTGAFMHAAEAFFGKEAATSASSGSSPGAPNSPATTTRFTDVIDDTIDARVYQGIHFRAADVQAAAIGSDVAHWLDKNFLEPVK